MFVLLFYNPRAACYIVLAYVSRYYASVIRKKYYTYYRVGSKFARKTRELTNFRNEIVILAACGIKK